MKKSRIFYLERSKGFNALQQGVYGSYYTGQLGKATVGGTWKDKKTLRIYKKPSNPNTSAQQSQRGKFKISQVVASALLATIIHPYWNPFATSQSGFNSFIGINSQLATDNQAFTDLLITKGSYEPLPGIADSQYDTSTGNIDTTWDPNVANIGDPNDRVIMIVIDKSDYDPLQKTPILLTVVQQLVLRSAGSDGLTYKSGLLPADIFVALGVIQPASQTKLRVANSVIEVTVAP